MDIIIRETSITPTFNIKKQIKEFDEKLTVEDKTTLNEKLADLKLAHSEKNLEKIDESVSSLNEAWSAISTKLYQQSAEQPTNEGGAGGNDEVQDADFEEVK
jgi:molecular chaperone DnaK